MRAHWAVGINPVVLARLKTAAAPHMTQCLGCSCVLLRRERKLMYRVVFPFELKLPNTTDDAAGRDALYSLFAVVVHVGSGPHHGEQALLSS